MSREKSNLKKTALFAEVCDKNNKLKGYGFKVVKLRNSKLVLIDESECFVVAAGYCTHT
jgi:hypothetical protein